MERQEIDKLQKFQRLVQTEPNPAEIRTNPAAGNIKYLPISFLEMTMDEIFFGLWSTESFEWKREGNEICGSLTLKYFHPTAHVWLSRIGASATMIRLQKGAQPYELEKKIYNALEMDLPHLKSDCFRNAVQSIGKAFGRDLNRAFFDQYKALLHIQNLDAGAVTANSEFLREMDRARVHYDTILQLARMDDQNLSAYTLALANCQTPKEIYQLADGLKDFVPDGDPRQQLKKLSL
jgi:hypothetical protein